MISDAATAALPKADADLLFSRFGVMFFVDPTAAFTNLRLAMRPGGRLLFAAWRPLADNPWFACRWTPHVRCCRRSLHVDPNAPGPLAFADAERVRRILTTAGWHDITAVRHDVPMRLSDPGKPDQATEFATRVGPLSRLLAEAGPDLHARARSAVAEALKSFDGPDGVSLTGSIWLVSARA